MVNVIDCIANFVMHDAEGVLYLFQRHQNHTFTHTNQNTVHYIKERCCLLFGKGTPLHFWSFEPDSETGGTPTGTATVSTGLLQRELSTTLGERSSEEVGLPSSGKDSATPDGESGNHNASGCSTPLGKRSSGRLQWVPTE